MLIETVQLERPRELLAASTNDDVLKAFATKLLADSRSIEEPRSSLLREDILAQREGAELAARRTSRKGSSEVGSERPVDASSRGSTPVVFTNENTVDSDDRDHTLDAAKEVKEGDLVVTKYTSSSKYWARIKKIVSSTTTITAAASWCDGSGTTTIRLWQQSGKADWYEKPASPPSLATASRMISCFFQEAEAGCLSTGNIGAKPFTTSEEFALAWDDEIKDDPCKDESESARLDFERRLQQKVDEFKRSAEAGGSTLPPDYLTKIRRVMQADLNVCGSASLSWMKRHPQFGKRVAESAESIVGKVMRRAALQQYAPTGCIIAEKMAWPVQTDSFEEFSPFHYLLGRDALRPPTGETLMPSQKWIDGLPHENSVFAGAINSSIPGAGDLVTVYKKNLASSGAMSSEFGYIVLAVVSPFDMNQINLASNSATAIDTWMECCLDLDQYCLFAQRFVLKGHGVNKEIQLVDHRNQTLAVGELQPEVLQYGLRSEEWHTISVRSSSELKLLLGEAVLQRLSQGMREHPIFSALFADDVHEMQGALSGAVFDWLRSPELFAQRIGGTEAMVKHIVGSGIQTASAVISKPIAAAQKPTARAIEKAMAEYTDVFNRFTATLIKLPPLYSYQPLTLNLTSEAGSSKKKLTGSLEYLLPKWNGEPNGSLFSMHEPRVSRPASLVDRRRKGTTPSPTPSPDDKGKPSPKPSPAAASASKRTRSEAKQALFAPAAAPAAAPVPADMRRGRAL